MLEQRRIEWLNQNTRVCPINNTSNLVGKKFTTLILRNMMHNGQTRFNQFLKIEGINAKILSARLREMERNGLIRREIFKEIPVRVEYTLTEKGWALEWLLYQMAAFSIEYFAKDVFKDGKARNFEEVYGFRLPEKASIGQFMQHGSYQDNLTSHPQPKLNSSSIQSIVPSK